ncbi:SpoIIE family protein phosphatase [Streptomyces sp. NPDC058293]|uniref:SpoIIE family protein phosphatase n=1 Tax=Streptomyces sp. NPDC058293 TaxID=3346429 RepID=UPI0036EC7510
MGFRSEAGGGDPLKPFDMATAALLMVDSHGVIAGWNQAAQDLLGYTAADVLGHSVTTLLVDEGDVPVVQSWLLGAENGWEGLLATFHREGRPVELAVRAWRLHALGGHREWLVALRDAAALRENEWREDVARSLLQRSPLGVAVLGTDLRYEWVNPAMAHLDEEVSGAATSPAAGAEPSPIVARQAKQVLKSGQAPVALENIAPVRVAGREDAGHVRLRSSFPLSGADGNLLGVGHAVLDFNGQDPARERLTLLNRASEHIGTTLDLDRTVHELAEVVVPYIADFVAVDLLESVHTPMDLTPRSAECTDTLCRAAHLSIQEDLPEVSVGIGATSNYPKESPQRRSLATGQPIREEVRPSTPWLAKDPLRWAKLIRLGVHTQMVVPVRARGINMGVITLLRWENPRPFDEDDLLLVEDLVGRAAVCVDNARRYTRQQQAALTLQKSLLPQDLPDLSAVEAAYRYLPADAEVGVGGDWFDVIPLSGARVALVVGDVVGHGIHAAASMARLRAAVQTLADLDLPPDELLTKVDDLVVRLSDEAEATSGGPVVIGASCVYAIYDPIARTVTMARAGHPTPAIAHLDAPVEFPDVPAGPPLGLGGLPFESAEIPVEEGSIIALYTDGLIEASDRDIDVGFERLCFALAHPDRPLDEICDTMVRILLPDRPSDDVAFLIARTRVLSSDCVAAWDVPAEPSAVHEARERSVSQLRVWGMQAAAFTTELIVSELVTNAIRHASGPISLRLIREHTLICEVSDGSSTSPHMRRASSTEEGGRGLFLVAGVAQRWGTRYTADGKTIWAEQPLPASA